MKTQTEQNHAKAQAFAQLESILEMVDALKLADENGMDEERDEARTAIHEDALSVQVRSGWVDSFDENEAQAAEEFCILLCTGGPAVRLIGSLESGDPSSARLEYQDWGTPWTELHEALEHQDALLAYASTFYFGA